jgi:uncharacterized protein YkuJ
MKNAAEFAQNLIERARRMQEFRIMKPQPENFIFNGKVPFDVSIKNEMMTFTVHAVDLAEANAMVDKYLDDNSAQEW